jgi:hypothetical protein
MMAVVVVVVEVVLNFYVKNKRRNTIKSGEIFSPLLTYNNVYER